MNQRMPVLFIGHGNPMNAIDDNAFTQNLAAHGRSLPRPQAVLCVSAHWMTEGTWVTGMAKPKTIHDFYGFPEELFAVQYPAPGSPQTAALVQSTVRQPSVQVDNELWGLDHGTWSVLKHMYPEADVPVVQLSIYMSQPAQYHFQVGEQLRPLRDHGILIVGSGNIVHNLRKINFSPVAKPHGWAVEFDAWVKGRLDERDFAAIVNAADQSEIGRLSIPTPDHWYPFITALGVADPNEKLTYVHEGVDNASISMRCVQFGEAG
jgi:4,5-DOPA dioxygenase extradiol